MGTVTSPAPVLERPDLGARIGLALDAGSLLLIADGGFGKTMALRQALEGRQAAWVSCGDAGGDGGRLLDLILEAIRDTVPGAADVLAERRAAASEAVDAEQGAAALARELARLLVDPLVLVLDDAESLEHSEGAEAVVARLVAGEHSVLRVIVSARRPLGVRLARERAAGRVTELGPGDLAFSATECEAYLRLARGRAPLPEEVDALVEETEGWPLGVSLAVSGSGARGPSRELVRSYFEEELLGGLDPERRRQLLAASMAPDHELAEAAGLVPAGEPAEDFHPLFREFLRERFEAEVPEADRREVAAALAPALEAAGRGPDAVAQWLAAEDWDAAASAISREGGALVRRAPETVEGWLAALPADRADRPDLVLLAGRLAHGHGRLGEAVARCRAAVDGFDAAGAPPALRFAARFALADVYLGARQFAAAAALGDVLDDPAAEGDLGARAVGALAAIGLASEGRFDEGRELRDRAFADPVAAPIRGQAPVFEAFWLDLPAGRLDDALLHVDQGLAVLERMDPFGRLPYVTLFKFAIHEERGEDEEALAAAVRGRHLARQSGLTGWIGAATSIRIASLRARMGDIARAEAELADVGPGWESWGTWEFEAARAAIAAARGESREARDAAERAAADADAQGAWFERMRCAAITAPSLVRAGEADRARQIVEQTLADRPPGFSGARLQALLAWLLHDEGDAEGSVAALAAGWAEAGDQARHLIRREWPRLERPLWAATAAGAIDPEAAIAALAEALPGGAAVEPFLRHPVPAVRRAALLAAVAAGHPEGVDHLEELSRDSDPDIAAAARAATEQLRRDPPPLAFRLLGGFELRRGAWTVDESAWQRRVAERLVRLLLCRGGPVPEDELIEAFWPDKPPTAGRRSLQVAVSAARGVLDVAESEHSRLVAGDRAYRLALRDTDTVDAEEFERGAHAALGAPEATRRAALVAAAERWTGEPLPEDRYEDWAIPWRERLVDLHAEVLAALCDAHVEAGDLTAAVDVARRLVALDPLDEGAHRRLIAAYARAGRRGHALRQFLACRRTLVEELGVEPGAETLDLQRKVLAGEAV